MVAMVLFQTCKKGWDYKMSTKRGYHPKVRNSYVRKRRNTILIVAEGKNKTETLYLRDFAREYGQALSFVSGNYTDPVNMVNTLIKDYKSRELSVEDGDVGYCLIDADFDSSKDVKISSVDRIASKHKVRVLISAPCFEVWYLCHYGAFAKKYNSNEEVISELRKHCSNYEKNAAGMFAATKDMLFEAVENAGKLRCICERNGMVTHTTAYSPSTEIDELAKCIISCCV